MFGAVLVIMMVFRPGGIIPKRRKAYQLRPDDLEPAGSAGSAASAEGGAE
jgi:hypothetical protein